MKHSKVDPEFKKQFIKLINGSNKIVITAHKSPDDDSVASVLSVYNFISTKYPKKQLQMIYTGERVEKYKVFKNYDKVEFVRDVVDVVDGVDLLIMLDGSQYERFTEKPEGLKIKAKNTICIDHHNSPIDKFSLSLVVPSISSNAELIYLSLYQNEEIDKDLAEIFMLGILGDTNNFLYLKAHQSDTLITAKKLMEISGMEMQEFQSRYCTISKRAFAIIQELVSNTRYYKMKNWPAFQTSFLSKESKKKEKYTNSEISEASHVYLSHYLRLIDGHTWGFIITSKSNGTFDISLRSLPSSVNVREMMERMAIGGGHDRASGGTFRDQPDAESCLKKTMSWMSENLPKLS